MPSAAVTPNEFEDREQEMARPSAVLHRVAAFRRLRPRHLQLLPYSRDQLCCSSLGLGSLPARSRGSRVPTQQIGPAFPQDMRLGPADVVLFLRQRPRALSSLPKTRPDELQLLFGSPSREDAVISAPGQ